MTNPSFAVAWTCRQFIQRALYSHKAVESCTVTNNIHYQIKRTDNRSDVNMVFVDEYVLGEATCYEVIEKFENVQVIVNNGTWNHMAVNREDFYQNTNILVFKITDFFGALHLSRMEKYVSPEEREEIAEGNRANSKRN